MVVCGFVIVSPYSAMSRETRGPNIRLDEERIETPRSGSLRKEKLGRPNIRLDEERIET
jgi:hypothetical protein